MNDNTPFNLVFEFNFIVLCLKIKTSLSLVIAIFIDGVTS